MFDVDCAVIWTCNFRIDPVLQMATVALEELVAGHGSPLWLCGSRVARAGRKLMPTRLIPKSKLDPIPESKFVVDVAK
jgi:hypothetical protein